MSTWDTKRRNSYWISMDGSSGFQFDVSTGKGGEIYLWKKAGITKEQAQNLCEKIDQFLTKEKTL